MFFQVRLLLLLSPQPTKAQVQTNKSIFQSQMKKHRRLQKIMITREGKRINYIAAQCTRHCAALVLWNSSPSLFSTLLSVLQCNLATVAVFLNPSLIVNCSNFSFTCVCKVLLMMPPHFHIFCPYSFCLFLVCDPLMFVPSCCLRTSVCWISCCLILTHLSTHLVLVADCCVKLYCCIKLSL